MRPPANTAVHASARRGEGVGDAVPQSRTRSASGARSGHVPPDAPLRDAGDDRVLPPFLQAFPTYVPNIQRRGARIVLSPLREEDAFRPRLIRFLPEAWHRNDRIRRLLGAHPEHRLAAPYEEPARGRIWLRRGAPGLEVGAPGWRSCQHKVEMSGFVQLRAFVGAMPYRVRAGRASYLA